MPKRKTRTKFPPVGTVLKKQVHNDLVLAKVVSVNESTGRVAVEMNGVTYSTLSAAAKALTGHATNGWKFWGLE